MKRCKSTYSGHPAAWWQLALAAILGIGNSAGADERFSIDDYLQLRSISEIALSPDGLYVAYTLTARVLEQDSFAYSVWIQPVAGGAPLRMSVNDSSASGPAWSPDGRYLAVLSDRKDDKSQVWLYDRRGGDAQQLTELPQGVKSFRWSPDGTRLLLLAADPRPADLDEKERPNPRPYVIDRLQFKADYVGYLDRYRTHIHIVELEDRSVRQVTFGDYDDSEPVWAPDSRRIAFISNRSAEPEKNRNTDVWIVDTADADNEIRQLTRAATAEASPSWSPDGRNIILTSTVAYSKLPIYAIPQLATVDVATGELSIIDALAETQVFSPRFSADGKALLAITEYRGQQQLVRVEQETGAVQALVEGRDVVVEFDLSTKGAIVLKVARPGRPGELFALAADGIRQLSTVNEAVLGRLQIGRVEKFGYESDDGTPMETFIVYPPDYTEDRTYPGMLHIHGGPQEQWDYRFDSESQLFAAQGYIVVMPNPRGSWGYGQTFGEAIYRDWGGIDFIDVMAAVDFAIDRGFVDPDRMAVYGWSYGGMIVNHVITKTNRFRAAITGASATLYSANYGHDEYQRWWEEELGLPWLAENRANWERISPFYALDKVETPTLVVGGENDWNVPTLNSEQLYIVLKRRGIPTQLVVYPDQHHLLSVPSYEKDLLERYVAWLKRYVTGP